MNIGRTSTIMEMLSECDCIPTELEVPIDISHLGIEVLSADPITREVSWRRVLKTVYKGMHPTFTVMVEWQPEIWALSVTGSAEHRILVLGKDGETEFKSLEELCQQSCTVLGEDQKPYSATVWMTGVSDHIYDIEVADTHTYFSDGILSHNTFYGDPSDYPGGEAYKHNLHLSCRLRRKDWLLDDKEIVGGEVAVTVDKNKWALPGKTDDSTHLRLYFKDGIERNYEEGLIDEGIRAGIIVVSGGWCTVLNPDGSERDKVNGTTRLRAKLKEDEGFADYLKQRLY